MSHYVCATKRWRRIWLTTVCALFFLLANSQMPYNKVYKENRPAMLFSSIVKMDSSFYLIGITADTNSPFATKILIGQMELSGDLISYRSIWDGNSKFYGAFFNSLIKTTQNDLAFAGDSYDSLPRALFGRFNSKLDSISIIEYQTPFSYAFQSEALLEYDSNVFYIAGVRTDSSSLRSNVMLMKVDGAGNKQWEKYYGLFSVAESTTNFIKLNNGNLMIGSYRRDFNMTQERSYTWLLEVDTEGTMVRQWLDPNDSTYGAYGLIETKDGGFIYGAQKKVDEFWPLVYYTATVVKMNSSFQKQWTFRGGGKSLATGIYDIEELEDSSFIACGNTRFAYPPDGSVQSGWVVKLSSSGEVLWERTYEGFTTSSAENYLYDIDILPDGGFIACGEANGDDGQFGWILRLDSNGCEIENCMVGMGEVLKSEPVEVKIYPNPAKDEVTVEFNTLLENDRIDIVDICGRVVKSIKVDSQRGKIEISTSELSNGALITLLFSEEKLKAKGRFNILK